MITLNRNQQLMYDYLISFVKNKGDLRTIGYKELYLELNLNYPFKEYSQDLNRVSELSFERDNVLLSALVSTGPYPGRGFFVLPRRKNLIPTANLNEMEKRKFWLQELEKVYMKYSDEYLPF